MELQASQVEQGLDANGVPIDTTKSVTKTTTESLKSGEIIYEAIMVWNQETLDLEKYADNLVNNPEFPRPIRNSFWAGQGCSSDLDVDDSLLFVINKIRTSHLHDALLTLNFSTVLRLFRAIDKWTAKNINPILVNRILSFLLKDHHDEISTTRSLKPFLENIRVNVAANIKRERNIVGYNISALKFLKQDRIDAGTVVFGEQKPVEEAQGVKRKRVAVVS